MGGEYKRKENKLIDIDLSGSKGYYFKSNDEARREKKRKNYWEFQNCS